MPTKSPQTALVAAGTVAATLGGLALVSRRITRRIEREVPADGSFTEIDGTRIHYVDRGPRQGPVLLMIHGLSGQVRNFSYGVLDRLVADYRVILIDRPGSGYSGTADAANAGTQARVVAHCIDALGLDRPLIVGHSLGGAVALALALDHTDKVGGLALIAPLTQPQDAPPAAFRRMAIPSAPLRRTLAWTVATPLALATGRRTTASIFAPEPVPADFSIRGGGALAARPGNIYAASSDLLAAGDGLRDMVRRYPDLALPVGILFGREDQVLDPAANGEHTAALIPGAELTMTEGGHMIPITRPALVADWLRSRAAI